ncbi:mRNA capping enzyme, putative [Theileria equi strain WA]|uniref:mRNA guanylyltransferase n=1 Tax=Theileria equi strain WA TaxID=1537102 RepID=L0AW21_THEEQ|nr:mRNA capping enzyme, putative [Theileria equi strain WA]AFZ79231.1 mRNA capping enzyme, putative [Theileria equi strain WA]|eukprot:XP_004828897.1 mRNA capping enzyme, putative [Theileria equi strain WA]
MAILETRMSKPPSTSELPGTPITCAETRGRILKKVRELCGWENRTFPGSQPVSLCRDSLPLLFRSEYVVCEKSDGIRSLLLSASGSIFLIGRLEEVHQINMKLPLRGNPSEFQQLTLLDGEVVNDKYTVDGVVKYRRRYLCYDAICIHKNSLKHLNLLERLSMAYTDIMVPLVASKVASAPDDESQNYLEIYLKDFFDITQITHIDKFSNKLPHITDGLIFTPVRVPYTPGTCKSLLKWKPPHLNTVDFSIDVLFDSTKRPRLVELYVSKDGARSSYKEFLAPYGAIYSRILKQAITEQVGQIIVECSWISDSRVWTFVPNLKHSDPRAAGGSESVLDFDNGVWMQGGWYAERIREDKKHPNNISVVNSVKMSIEDDITFEMLVDEIEMFKKNGKVPLYNKCVLPKNYSIVQ